MVKRNEIPAMFTDEFLDCLDAWNECRRWECLPYSGGWAEQPCRLMDILKAFDAAKAQYDKDK